MEIKMKKKIIYFTILALWIGFIISQSCMPPDTSKQESDFITEIFRAIGFTGENLDVIVRKLAHLFEFFVLGMLFVTYFPVMGRKVQMIYPLFFSLAMAVTDEFIQNFTGRGSLVQDVVIDFTGAAIGILVFGIIYKNKNGV